MNSFSLALWTETFKMRRSKVPLFTSVGFSFSALVDGLFMIITKDPEGCEEDAFYSAPKRNSWQVLQIGQPFSVSLRKLWRLVEQSYLPSSPFGCLDASFQIILLKSCWRCPLRAKQLLLQSL